jgi:hypothetical protein
MVRDPANLSPVDHECNVWKEAVYITIDLSAKILPNFCGALVWRSYSLLKSVHVNLK